MLDKRYRAECLKLGMKFNYPVSNRYHTLLRQRHIQVAPRNWFPVLWWSCCWLAWADDTTLPWPDRPL